VGVNVHEAGSDDATASVDLFATALCYRANDGDPPTIDRYIRSEGLGPCAIDYFATANY